MGSGIGRGFGFIILLSVIFRFPHPCHRCTRQHSAFRFVLNGGPFADVAVELLAVGLAARLGIGAPWLEHLAAHHAFGRLVLDPAAFAAALVARQALALGAAGARHGMREIPMPDFAVAVFAAAGVGVAVLDLVLAAHAVEADPPISSLAGPRRVLAVRSGAPAFYWRAIPSMHDGDGSTGRNLVAAFHADVVGVTHV